MDKSHEEAYRSVVDATPVQVRLLGPMELRVENRPVPIGGARRKSALALLCLAGKAGMLADTLAASVFGSDVDARPLNTLQVHLSQLRRALDPYAGALTRVGAVYRLDPDVVGSDAAALERALTGWQIGRPGALPALRAAAEAWRGQLCSDLPDVDALVGPRARYTELYLTAVEILFDEELQSGARPDLPERIEDVLAGAPLRERLWAQLMLALYAVGRQTAALQTYHRARRVLADEVGVEPGRALRQLEALILRQADTLERTAPALAATRTHAVIWLDGSGSLRSVPLLPGREVTVGRIAPATILIDWDPLVSRRHASLTLTESGCTVRDLGSRNGTFANDVPVHDQALLTPGGTVRVGNTVIFLRAPAPRGGAHRLTGRTASYPAKVP